MEDGLTVHQRQCLEHLRRARALGLSLREYAGNHGPKVRVLYDAVVQFRRMGVLAELMTADRSDRSRAEPVTEKSSPFVAVRMAPERAALVSSLQVPRVRHVSGHVLEFDSWPPADVLGAILAGGHDVAA